MPRLPSTLKRSPEKAQRTYEETLKHAEAEYGSGERAGRTAYASLKHSFEKVGDHWEAKDRKGPKISYQVLMIPATNASVDTASYREFGTGRFLTRAFMKYGWDLYAPNEKAKSLPYVSPLRAGKDELKGLPPAIVITAENDPLRDDGEEYARKMKDAGVEVTAIRYNGMIHDFVALNALRSLPEVKAALHQISAGIRRHLTPAATTK